MCLVTGGAGAIGTAIASAFVENGATVIITDIRETDVTKAASAIGCDGMVQDVTSEDRWNEIIGQIESRHGQLDVLVNNAGILGSTEAVNPETTQVEDFRAIQRVNVEAVMLGCRAGSVAKIVKLEHAWRRLDGRNDDGFQVAPFPG